MKRYVCTLILSLLLTVVMLTAISMTDNCVLNAKEISAWDGSTAESFASGSGTKNDPYIIKTPSQFAYFAKSVNKGTSYEGCYIKLGADIVMNDDTFTFDPDTGLVKATDGVNTIYIGTGRKGDSSGNNDTFDVTAGVAGNLYASDNSDGSGIYSGKLYACTSVGSENNAFSGTFDGGSHSISGLYIKSTAQYDKGLFGYINNANIKNVRVENSYIFSQSYSGTIVGRASFSTIENCVGDALVFSIENVGGIAGNTEDTDIISSYNMGTVAGKMAVGGIVGTNGGDVRDCYNTGKIFADQMAGGAVGRNSGMVKNFYNIGKINASSDVGAVVGKNTGTTVNTYYSVGSVSGDSSGLTDTQMKNKNSFLGFDFQNVWRAGSLGGYEYPTLIAVDHKGHVHTYDSDCDASCNGCGYTRNVEHSYSSSWSKGESSHYIECSACGDKKNESEHSYDNACDNMCNICSYVRDAAHSYSTELSSDEDHHWYECTACGNKNDIAPHTPGKEATETTAQTCTVCGHVIKAPVGHTHDFDSAWKNNKENHYKECSCGAKSSLEAHEWNSGTVTKRPSEDEKGIMTYTCKVCSANKTAYIEKLPTVPEIPDDKPSDDKPSEEKPEDDKQENATNTPDIFENGGESSESEENKEENNEPNADNSDLRKDETDTDGDLLKQSHNSYGLAMALSISAIAIGVLILILFSVIIVLLLKKNKNRGND